MVKVRFDDIPHAGVVQYYARVKLAGKEAVVRIAMCKFYRPLPEVGQAALGKVLPAKVFNDIDNPETWTLDCIQRPYPVLLDSIDGKFMKWRRPSREDEDGYHYEFFNTYSFRSGS